MDPSCENIQLRQRIIVGALFSLMALLAIFLVKAHYVMAYSDPVSWCQRGEALLAGEPITKRAFLYPLFLGLAMKAVGPVYIFLVNIPWILVMVGLIFLLAKTVFNDEEKPLQGYWAGLLASTGIIVTSHTHLLVLANPYREPFAFSLMLISILLLILFFKGGAYWFATASAVTLGMGASTRETLLILIVPVGICFLVHWLADRSRRWLKGILWYCAPMALGLIPFFIQNHLHTGKFWLPGYIAEGVLKNGSLRLLRDISIPGMGLEYFGRVGSQTVEVYLQRYTWLGAVMILVCLIWAVRKRNLLILCLLFPFILLNGLFYSCYSYYKLRYCFVMDPFLQTLLAGGVVLTGYTALDRFKRLPKLAAPPVVFLALALALPAFAGWSMFRSDAMTEKRMKVWQVDDLREFMLDGGVQMPASFTGRKHYRNMLAWHLRGETYNIESRIKDQTQYFGKDLIHELGMDRFLHRAGTNLLEEVAGRNLYFIGDEPNALIRSWFSATPLLHLKDAPVPVEHYNRRLNKPIFHIQAWATNQVHRTLEGAHGKPSVLVMDMRRMMDVPGRSTVSLEVNGMPVAHTFISGVQFVTLPAALNQEDSIHISIRSDAPLPEDLTAELFRQGEELSIPLGASSRLWYYNFMDKELFRYYPLKNDASVLFHEAGLDLPCFAETNREVFAVFRVEFIQKDSYFGSNPQTLTVDAGCGASTIRLPAAGRSKEVTVRMGRGQGGVVMAPVRLTTSLPSRPDQKILGKEGVIRQHAFVKLYQVKMFTLPADHTAQCSVDVGSPQAGAFIESGWFDPEKVGEKQYVRWSSVDAAVRLPVHPKETGYSLIVHSRNVRPREFPARPEFVLNETPIPVRSHQTSADEKSIRYEAQVPAGLLTPGWENRLRIKCSPWIPGRSGSYSDFRELGMMVERIELKPDSG